jgi:glycine/D-amino acid oxidase-like deaminating enzyme
VAAGFSGHGMPQAFLCGAAVSDMVTGKEPAIFVDAFYPDLDGRTGAPWGSGDPHAGTGDADAIATGQ